MCLLCLITRSLDTDHRDICGLFFILLNRCRKLCPKRKDAFHANICLLNSTGSPQIAKLEPGDVASVNAGGAVVLKCFSEGEPTPSVYWQYSANGKGEVLKTRLDALLELLKTTILSFKCFSLHAISVVIHVTQTNWEMSSPPNIFK